MVWTGMYRSTLSVNGELAKELLSLARERRMTLFSLTNQILENSITLMKMGFDIQNLKDLISILKILKDLDVAVIPSDFLDKLLVKLYKVDPDELLRSFKQVGLEMADYLRLEAPTIEKLMTLAQVLTMLFPLKRVGFRRLDHNSYELSAVGVGGTMESTMCVYSFVEGVLEKYNMEIFEKNIGRGLLTVRFGEKI
jgi:hypothetical protein